MTLQSTDVTALVELWAGIKNYVPAKDQGSCAAQFIANIDEAGFVDFSVSGSDMYGVCGVFDKALRDYIHDNGLDESEDQEDWDE
jgi:hypothetical protein|tara:strand:+ start:922 stop:1176 length:255 start_codon:yes stop_codon:yes gene_type:complete